LNYIKQAKITIYDKSNLTAMNIQTEILGKPRKCINLETELKNPETNLKPIKIASNVLVLTYQNSHEHKRKQMET
jgi:hypothetical protein